MDGQPISDHDIFDLFPDVMIDRDNIGHYRGLANRRLLINRCQDCGYWIYPHRPLCPECHSWDVAPTEVSGLGKVFMFTLLHQLRDPDSVIMEPVVAAAIELAEQPGLRYLAKVVNCPQSAIALDMPVQLTWADYRGNMMPAFEPVSQQEGDARG